ncbi:hypothetical protein Agub_g5632, partial [Astrephomene gubernaculifera]
GTRSSRNRCMLLRFSLNAEEDGMYDSCVARGCGSGGGGGEGVLGASAGTGAAAAATAAANGSADVASAGTDCVVAVQLPDLVTASCPLLPYLPPERCGSSLSKQGWREQRQRRKVLQPDADIGTDCTANLPQLPYPATLVGCSSGRLQLLTPEHFVHGAYGNGTARMPAAVANGSVHVHPAEGGSVAAPSVTLPGPVESICLLPRLAKLPAPATDEPYDAAGPDNDHYRYSGDDDECGAAAAEQHNRRRSRHSQGGGGVFFAGALCGDVNRSLVVVRVRQKLETQRRKQGQQQQQQRGRGASGSASAVAEVHGQGFCCSPWSLQRLFVVPGVQALLAVPLPSAFTVALAPAPGSGGGGGGSRGGGGGAASVALAVSVSAVVVVAGAAEG